MLCQGYGLNHTKSLIISGSNRALSNLEGARARIFQYQMLTKHLWMKAMSVNQHQFKLLKNATQQDQRSVALKAEKHLARGARHYWYVERMQLQDLRPPMELV